jgi:hypothetical protein
MRCFPFIPILIPRLLFIREVILLVLPRMPLSVHFILSLLVSLAKWLLPLVHHFWLEVSARFVPVTLFFGGERRVQAIGEGGGGVTELVGDREEVCGA